MPNILAIYCGITIALACVVLLIDSLLRMRRESS